VAGDARARQELVERAWRAVAERLQRFPEDAVEEIRQQIAESVLRALHSGLSPHTNLDGFLHWRGRAEITSFVRRGIRSRRMTNLAEILDCAGFEHSPFARAQAAELRDLIERCSRSVPNERHRQAWALRFLQGLEPREVASVLEVRAAIARLWISRAAKHVRRCIERRLRSEDRHR